MSELACDTVAADSTCVAHVVKVTPTLVYLDVASESGVAIGDRFVVGREGPEENPFAMVAQVRVLGSFEKFPTAEIVPDSLGETSYQRVRRRNDPATSSNYRLSIGIGYGASM